MGHDFSITNNKRENTAIIPPPKPLTKEEIQKKEEQYEKSRELETKLMAMVQMVSARIEQDNFFDINTKITYSEKQSTIIKEIKVELPIDIIRPINYIKNINIYFYYYLYYYLYYYYLIYYSQDLFLHEPI